MYIEKLSKQEIEELFNKICYILTDGSNIGLTCVKLGKITKENDCIKLTFNLKLSDLESWCAFSDFSVNSAILSTHEAQKQANLFLRKQMYKKFGDEYYNDIRDFYYSQIFKECDKKLEKLSSDLKEMIK